MMQRLFYLLVARSELIDEIEPLIDQEIASPTITNKAVSSKMNPPAETRHDWYRLTKTPDTAYKQTSSSVDEID